VHHEDVEGQEVWLHPASASVLDGGCGVWSPDGTVVENRAPVHFEQGGGWSMVPLWILWRRKQSLGPARNNTIILGGRAHAPFTIAAELSQLCLNLIVLK
jgi:hypothetical protein